jgi:hypothetical protein
MVRATTILDEFEHVQAELVGTAVMLTDGKAGAVERVWLDELRGRRFQSGATMASAYLHGEVGGDPLKSDLGERLSACPLSLR